MLTWAYMRECMTLSSAENNVNQLLVAVANHCVMGSCNLAWAGGDLQSHVPPSILLCNLRGGIGLEYW